jgi:hypothetical protein
MGGANDPENIVEVTITQHAMFHFCNYQLWGNGEDRLAWRGLSRQITSDEAALEAMVLGGKKGGKIAGNKAKKNKTGICGRSPEKMSEDGKKGGKKGGKIAGNKHKENKTGIFGRSPEKMSEDGRKAGEIGGLKGGKTTSSQKWQCTETGYVSTAGGLTFYQNKRGIDTSNRIKVDGPRSWEITFKDGRVIVTTQALKDWAKENEYSYQCFLKVREGKVNNHKGIVKVVCL